MSDGDSKAAFVLIFLAEWVLEPGERLLITPLRPQCEKEAVGRIPKTLGNFQFRQSGGAVSRTTGKFRRFPFYWSDRISNCPQRATEDGEIPFVLVDFVDYLVSNPWPMPASTNQSLQRIENNQFGGDPSNWFYDSPTPGKPRKNRAPSILSISIENDGVRLEIALNSAGKYSVQRTAQLNGQWEEMQQIVIESETSSTVEIKDPFPQISQQFYRVVLLP